MSDADLQLAAALRQAFTLLAEIRTDMAAFNRLCEAFDWTAAEEAREAVLMKTEAYLDCYSRAHRTLEAARRGEG